MSNGLDKVDWQKEAQDRAAQNRNNSVRRCPACGELGIVSVSHYSRNHDKACNLTPAARLGSERRPLTVREALMLNEIGCIRGRSLSWDGRTGWFHAEAPSAMIRGTYVSVRVYIRNGEERNQIKAAFFPEHWEEQRRASLTSAAL